jgi:hypothetical protein
VQARRVLCLFPQHMHGMCRHGKCVYCVLCVLLHTGLDYSGIQPQKQVTATPNPLSAAAAAAGATPSHLAGATPGATPGGLLGATPGRAIAGVASTPGALAAALGATPGELELGLEELSPSASGCIFVLVALSTEGSMMEHCTAVQVVLSEPSAAAPDTPFWSCLVAHMS